MFQTAILSLFNDTNILTYGEIAQKTTIPKNRLDVALTKLCNPANELICKEIKKPIFDKETEKLTLNMKFTSKALRLNLIPLGAPKQAPSEVTAQSEKDGEKIEGERALIIDSKIVAIMKTNKQFNHMELTTKVMEMISMFKAQPPMIKQRIESLI